MVQQRDITIEEAAKREPDLVLRRIFGAPRDLVFRAFTDPAHLREWWGPRHFTVPRCEVDPRPGGVIDIDMQGPDGNIYPEKGVFHEVVENERLEFLDSAFEDEHGDAQLQVLNTITFEDRGGATWLTLECRVVRSTPVSAPALEMMEQGWTESFYKLADYVERQ